MPRALTDKLKIETVPLDSLKPWPVARQHGAKNLRTIKASLKEHGQVEPLVVRKETSEVIGGNGRLESMRALKWEACEIVRVDVTQEEACRLAIVLNRSCETSSWARDDLWELLDSLHQTGVDLEDLGWDAADLALLAPKPLLDPFSSGADEHPEMGHPIRVTREQREVFDLAAAKMRAAEKDTGPPLSDGRIVEFLAAEFISAP